MQLYKTAPPPLEDFYELLKKICMTTSYNHEDFYLFDINSYKKAIFYGYFNAFLDICKPYYHQSKQHYCERALSYNGITTIFRQICNAHKHYYTTKIQYDHSEYVIAYLFPIDCNDYFMVESAAAATAEKI